MWRMRAEDRPFAMMVALQVVGSAGDIAAMAMFVGNHCRMTVVIKFEEGAELSMKRAMSTPRNLGIGRSSSYCSHK